VFFFKTPSYKSHGELCAITWRKMEGREQVLYCSNMVHVAMSKKHSLDTPLSSPQRRDIRNEVVDTKHILIGKLQAEIDEDNVSVYLDSAAVPSHLFKTAKGVKTESCGLPPPLAIWFGAGERFERVRGKNLVSVLLLRRDIRLQPLVYCFHVELGNF